jgi:hypothetical protein
MSQEIGARPRQKSMILELNNIIVKVEKEQGRTSSWIPDFTFRYQGTNIVVKQRQWT